METELPQTRESRRGCAVAGGILEVFVQRLASPVGLDLGARTCEETAISIAAEIIATRWGGSGHRLAEGAGRIHHEPQPQRAQP
jgi:xanthine dehydrogenase accessory factor